MASLGILQRELGQFDPTLASFEQASVVSPQNPNVALNKAMLLDVMGKKKEAADEYNKVLGIQPHNALALNNLAFIDAEAGTNLQQAMTYAERAKQRPQQPEYFRHVRVCLLSEEFERGGSVDF